MLVENQVFTVKVNQKNIGWYQSKGHECNLKDEIIVKAEDLTIISSFKLHSCPFD